MKAPIAKKEQHIVNIHGVELIDNYAYLRDANWPKEVKDPKILNYIEQENSYFQKYILPKQQLKDRLFEEFKGKIKLDDQSTYTKRDDYYYFSRTDKSLDYPIYLRKKGNIDASEEILLDINEIAKGKKYTSIGSFAINKTHNLMAYSVDFEGNERYTIKIFDLDKKEYLTDEIPGTIGNIVWHEHLAGFFYTPTDENWRHDKIMFHKLGDLTANDQLIFQEKDKLYNVGISKSSSRDYFLISVSGHDNNEIHYFDAKDETFTPKLVKERRANIIYSIDHGANYFYMHTNEDATKFKILRCKDSSSLTDNNWQEYIKQRPEENLDDFDLTKNYLLLNFTRAGLPKIEIIDLKSQKVQEVKFPDSAFSAGVYSTNYLEDDIRINYTSFARPSVVYNYDFGNDQLQILKEQEIPSGHNPEDYETQRIMAKSSDGEMIPISLIYKKSLFKKDGSNPLYLYGYGSYGISSPPSYRNSAIMLADRGFVYAIAHIRGGSDIDYEWYQAAKFLTKKRTFEDFIACAEHLINHKYSSAGNVVIMGGSAGGLLVGNVINMRPDLFKAAIAHVPFVDLMHTMLDEELPLTPGEFKEWGNPKDKEYFDYMLTYSPYDNVKPQNYPSLFITAGLSDPRVGYWEAAKWAAKLRELKTDNNILLLKTNMDFGHSGASGRFEYLKEAAEDLVFIFDQFGINE